MRRCLMHCLLKVHHMIDRKSDSDIDKMVCKDIKEVYLYVQIISIDFVACLEI